jgi:hypothetical protein
MPINFNKKPIDLFVVQNCAKILRYLNNKWCWPYIFRLIHRNDYFMNFLFMNFDKIERNVLYATFQNFSGHFIPRKSCN